MPISHTNLAPRLRSAFCNYCLLLVACCLGALGQNGTGGMILGTAIDPSGAAVPNVQLTITNIHTNQPLELTTNAEGEYLAPDLQIGHYMVRAQALGFKTFEQKNIVLNVGRVRAWMSNSSSAAPNRALPSRQTRSQCKANRGK